MFNTVMTDVCARSRPARARRWRIAHRKGSLFPEHVQDLEFQIRRMFRRRTGHGSLLTFF